MLDPSDDLALDAFVLAGLAAGDPELTRCAIAPALGMQLRPLVSRVQAELRRDRSAAMLRLAASMSLRVTHGDGLSARARAIVAPLAERSLMASWVEDAPAPRSGFRTSVALRRTVAALVEARWRG